MSWKNRCVASAKNLRFALENGYLRFCPEAAVACIEAYRLLFTNCLREMPPGRLPDDCVQMLSEPISLGKACWQEGYGCHDAKGWCTGTPSICHSLPRIQETCEGVCAEPGVCNASGICVPGETGDTCVSRRDCRTELFCVDGTCQAASGLHEYCTADSECLPGLLCGAEKTCVVPEPICHSPNACGEHAQCIPNSMPTCRTRKSEQETCASHEQCRPELFCDHGLCLPRPGDGEVCADEGGLCGVGLACDGETGRCIALPQEGSPCAWDMYGPFVCDTGLACIDGICSPLPGEGQPCGQGTNRCAPGLGCAFREDGTNICEPKGEAGAPCTNDSQCIEGTFCNCATNVCTPVYALGERCRDGNECGPEAECRIRNPGGEPECAPIPQNGDTCFVVCTDDSFCAAPDGRCLPPICAEIF